MRTLRTLSGVALVLAGALALGLAIARALASRLDRRDRSRVGAPAPSGDRLRSIMAAPLPRRSPLIRVIAIAISIGVPAALWLLPAPSGLTEAGWHIALVMVGGAIAWLLEPVPDFAVALGMAAAWGSAGLAPPSLAFGGFASSAWVIALAALGISSAMAASGLLFRFALMLLRVFPPTHRGQVAALLVSGVVLTPVVPTVFGRVATAAPVARELSQALGYARAGRESAAIAFAAILGNFVVLPIGGADMPVVISLLNAFTGLSAAATGIALNNTALIVAGMIVGASGSILTNLMAEAMNRSIPNIIAGGFGGGGAVAGAVGAGEHEGTVRSTSAADAAIQLSYARQVVIVPGYGMAVAQAQHAVHELAKQLEARGIEVKYAIHPVAGRMPGHMNVLLAEADVPYDQLKEMDDINPEFPRTDVSLVIGANDVTNPAANTNPDSPIYGMPILNVNESESVIVIKRSMNPGFAGIDNELYYDPKTQMLFGDAKGAVGEITEEIKAL